MDLIGRHGRVAVGRRHAGEPGGDIAIVVPGWDDDVFCFLGDVTGHGAPASRFARELEELVRQRAARLSPGALLVEVNARLANTWRPDVFASAVCLWLDAAHGWGTIAVAGQLPPAVRTTSTRALPIPSGPPLGMFLDQAYSEHPFELADGEVMVLVTDGVTDPLGTELDALGFEALLKLIDHAPPDFAELCADLLGETAARRSQDDATVIVLGRSTWEIGHPLCSVASS
jgi:sigma-B regulation protein RsbU (phosphoserine phosphatase)